jgi:prolyl-tRNA synthetase
MMRDGKALQLATSHELGQNFARAFDITYTDEHGTAQHCWTTSWGSSTRMIGGLIMSHGDDAGLRLPPRVAPVQVILVAVKDAPGVSETIARVERELGDLGIRVRADRRTDIGLGRRLTDWELKGVPVRIEVGPRDLAANQVTVVRRDDSQPDLVTADAAAAVAVAAVDAVQTNLYDRPPRCRPAAPSTSPTSPRRSTPQEGFARLPWSACHEDGERALNAAGISIRCVTTREGTVPDTLDTEDLVAIVARAY